MILHSTTQAQEVTHETQHSHARTHPMHPRNLTVSNHAGCYRVKHSSLYSGENRGIDYHTVMVTNN